MAVYWLLFAFAAIMALAYPVGQRVGQAGGQAVVVRGVGQSFAFASFALAYTLIGALRYEIGGDWPTYMTMLDDMSHGGLGDALTYTDPLFGLLAWVSLQVGGGIYMINGVACLILVWGVIAVSSKLPEPWLATLIAVPYTLIVVGMGYVRQGAAIGLLLVAIAHFDRARPGRTILYMVLAAGFHSTAVFAYPAFAWSLARKNKGYAVAGAIVASIAFIIFLAPRLTNFENGYLDSEYDSSGAAVRLAMSLLPSLLILAKYKSFAVSDRARGIWISIALANIIASIALGLSSSSTAVDRIALFFSIIQIVAFGRIMGLLSVSPRMVLLTRLAMIAIAGAVQIVWLGFGTHAIYWVPYQSILQFL